MRLPVLIGTQDQFSPLSANLSNHLDHLTYAKRQRYYWRMPNRSGLSSAFDFSPHVRDGDTVTWLQGTGEPLGLTNRLVAQRHALPPLELFVGMMSSKTLRPEHADRLRFRGLNGAGTARNLTAANLLDIVPAYVSAVPGLIRSGVIKVDVVLLRVRPHPKPGYFTVGVMADFLPAMVQAARCVIAEIDDRLPMTAQDALVAAEDIDVLTECDADEVLMPDPEPTDIDMRVASHVAGLIPDGATIQLGVGGLPVAVCRALLHHKDLGVHSGVISDIVVDLVEKGVITNARKGIDAGRIVTGGLFGSRRLMNFADGNSKVEIRCSEYTHNQQVLSRLPNLYAINSGVEVDLTGNVNSEIAAGPSVGCRILFEAPSPRRAGAPLLRSRRQRPTASIRASLHRLQASRSASRAAISTS